MPDKHRGAVDFNFAQGAFRPLTTAEPLQLYHTYEWELPAGKTITLSKLEIGKRAILCASGSGEATSSDRTFAFASGDLLLCGEELTISSKEQALRCYCLVFDALAQDRLHASSDLEDLALYFHECGPLVKVDGAVEYQQAYATFLAELCLPEPTMLLVKGYFYQTMIAAYRRLSNRHSENHTHQMDTNVVGQTVYAIIRYIDEHLFSINNLADMAKELGYSYNYLSHLFRRKTGMTIQAYVTQKKIDQSMHLLVDERYSVTQIASMLNYDCIQSFSKAFRRAKGMSPTEYRAKHLNTPN